MSLLLLATTITTALVGGIFFAFSTLIMGALARLESREGHTAMVSINRVVLNPWFFAAFFGAGLLCATCSVLVSVTDTNWQPRAVMAGSVLYLLGCIAVTIAGNVPLNNRLDGVPPGGDGADDLWMFYLRRWTLLNHIRTAASLAAAGAFGLALMQT